MSKVREGNRGTVFAKFVETVYRFGLIMNL